MEEELESKPLNVRGVSPEDRERIKKWAKRVDQSTSAAVRVFVIKCLEYCDEFNWEEFKAARIVRGTDLSRPAAKGERKAKG